MRQGLLGGEPLKVVHLGVVREAAANAGRMGWGDELIDCMSFSFANKTWQDNVLYKEFTKAPIN